MLQRKAADEILLDEICEGAGVTIGAFYWYFKTKDGVVEEIAIDAIRDLFADFDAAPMDGDLYETFYAVNQAQIAKRDLKKLARTVAVLLHTNEQVFAEWWRLRQAFVSRLAALAIKARRDAGLPSLGMAQVMEFLLAGTEGVHETLFHGAAPGREPAPADLRATVAKLAATWHRAVLARDPDPTVVRRVSARAARAKPAPRK